MALWKDNVRKDALLAYDVAINMDMGISNHGRYLQRAAALVVRPSSSVAVLLLIFAMAQRQSWLAVLL